MLGSSKSINGRANGRTVGLSKIHAVGVVEYKWRRVSGGRERRAVDVVMVTGGVF